MVANVAKEGEFDSDPTSNNVGFDFAEHGAQISEVKELIIAFPTSTDFDLVNWTSAINQEDIHSSTKSILESGAWIGERLSFLRSSFSNIFGGFEPDDAIRCAIGYANASYLQNRPMFDRARRREGKRIGVGTTLLGHTTIKLNGTDQLISEDHLVTTTIDALSHALYHACNCDPSTPSNGNKGMEAARAFQVSNFEFVYRMTWQQVLWEGYAIKREGTDFYLRPCSERYGEWWPVWDVRRQNLIAEQISVMSQRIFGDLDFAKVPQNFKALFPKMRVKKANWRDGTWSYKTVPISNRDKECRSIALAAIGIRDASLWPYVDKRLPNFSKSGLTLGNVLQTWQALESALEAISKSISKSNRKQITDIRDFSFRIERKSLIRVLSECTGLNSNVTSDALDFLEIDLRDFKFLFNRGVWANPIIRDSNRSYLNFVFPVFTIGNIVRAFENWVEQCDFARSGELKGANFEREVIDQLSASASITELPVKVEVFGPNLKIADEEIDGILKVGNCLFVLECKSFLTPGDPIERFNCIKRIRKGAAQAERKAARVRENWRDLDSAITGGVSEEKPVQGIVVTAGPYGVGLNFGEVPVVDIDYLAILASSLTMITAMAVKGDKEYQEVTHLYNPFSFSTDRFCWLLRRPFVQDKYFEVLQWRYEPFPSGKVSPRLMLPFPLIAPESDAHRAKELISGL